MYTKRWCLSLLPLLLAATKTSAVDLTQTSAAWDRTYAASKNISNIGSRDDCVPPTAPGERIIYLVDADSKDTGVFHGLVPSPDADSPPSCEEFRDASSASFGTNTLPFASWPPTTSFRLVAKENNIWGMFCDVIQGDVNFELQCDGSQLVTTTVENGGEALCVPVDAEETTECASEYLWPGSFKEGLPDYKMTSKMVCKGTICG